jgi:hypothetical protein
VPPRASTRPDAEPSQVDLETKLETELNGTSEPGTPELATRQRPETVSPGKRQRPPYLRLVR